MKLSELDGRLVRHVVERDERGVHEYLPTVETVAEAMGVMFLCPKCFAANGGPVGTHSVLCWFADRGVPADLDPLPGRWIPSGTTIDDLTFIGPAAASVQLTGASQ